MYKLHQSYNVSQLAPVYVMHGIKDGHETLNASWGVLEHKHKLSRLLSCACTQYLKNTINKK